MFATHRPLLALGCAAVVAPAQTAFTPGSLGLGFGGGSWAAVRANGDLRGDLIAVVSPQPGSPVPLVVAVSAGATSFNSIVSFLPQTSLGSFVAGDLTGDNLADFVVTTAAPNHVATLYVGDGFGGFLGTSSPVTGVRMLAMADADGDGDQDIFGLAGTSLQILFGNGAGALVPGPTTLAGSPDGFAIGDLDGDLDLDFVWCAPAWAPTAIRVYLQQPGGALVLGPTANTVVPADGAVALLDADGDADLDVAFVTDTLGLGGPPNALALARNNGAGALTPGPVVPLPRPGTGAFVLRSADFDGDSLGDLVVARAGAGPDWAVWSAFGGLQAPHRASSLLQTASAEHSEAQVYDWDGDGDADVVMRRPGAAYEIARNLRLGSHAGGYGPLLGGCANTLRLQLAGSLQPGGAVTLATSQAPPGAIAVLAVGFAAARIAVFPGCYQAFAAPAAAVLLRSLDASGAAAVTLQLPVSPAMTGVRFVAQDVVFDPAFAHGLDTTNGVWFVGG